MAKKPAKKPSIGRILITNDDGIHAPGLKSLEKIAKALSDDVWVVAPEQEQSGAGRSLTLSDPIRVRKVSARRFAVKGTPTDCVLMAVRHLMAETPPVLILSGVNRGQNIADDVTYSGTIAAAMEGTALGIPSIAMSQAYGFTDGALLKWGTAEYFGPEVIRSLLAQGWPENVLINVNFPDMPHGDVKGVRVTKQGKRDQSNLKIEEREDGRGHPYFWFGFNKVPSKPKQDTDLHAVYSGYISVTPLHLNLSHTATQKRLSASLNMSFGLE